MAKLPEPPLEGGCQCGKLRYRVTARPLTLYCCHCTECQAQSSSAFGMSLLVSGDSVETEGEWASRIRNENTDGAIEGVFCPSCGTRVIHRGGIYTSIKAGTLDDRSWLKPVGHIWTRSAQGWVKLDGLVYETQPDEDDDALTSAFSHQFS